MNKIEIYTYDKQGLVTKHKNFISARIKALYQALILGVDSYVDYWDGKFTRTKYYYKGWRPFKFLYKVK